MTLDDQMPSSGPDIFYSREFRIVIEDHLSILKNTLNSKTIIIKNADAFKYEGDLYGLLSNYAVPIQYHWIAMRMNNYTSPTQFTKEVGILLVPIETTIERIKSVFNTQNKIKL